MSERQPLAGAHHLMTGLSGADAPGIRRLNRLPVFLAIGIILLVLATIVFGLSSRGFLRAGRQAGTGDDLGPASSFAESLKRGVSDGIIGESQPVSGPAPPPPIAAPQVIPAPQTDRSVDPADHATVRPATGPVGNGPDDWRERLERDHEEEILNERHLQAMARMQRADGARAAPLRIDTDRAEAVASGQPSASAPADGAKGDGSGHLSERLLAAAEAAGLAGSGVNDANGQAGKLAFLNEGRSVIARESGRQAQISQMILKRGSVIPALLLTGINADLPGRILAQVSQNIYDSATGRHLLIPQGSRLLGRYDAKISYGQSRVLVVWTDLILPDGQSLAIGAMAGIDQAGEAGFTDRVDRHLFRTFGSAALIALIGTGMDLALPDNGLSSASDPSDAARRSFSETFGRLAERTISKNLDVQPTLSIRPGYRFNILVDQDLVFS